MRKAIHTGLLVIFTLSFAACSSDPKSVTTSPAAIKAAIYNLKGGSVDAAISYLGLPDNDAMVANRRVLVWHGGGDVAIGNVSNDNVSVRSFHCTVKAVVSAGDVISDVEIDDNSAYYCPRGKK
jgi:hypothetical protein